MRKIKPASESITINTYKIMPAHLNGAGVLFGGQLLSWIDLTAAITGFRHSDHNVVTAAIDKTQFISSANLSDVVIVTAKVTWVGRTSMEVMVDTIAESRESGRRLINKSYIILVAVDENNKPVEVPMLDLKTEEEKQEWKDAEMRALIRKERNQYNF